MRISSTLVATAAATSIAGCCGHADACGITPPVGPNGLPTICHGESDSLRLRLGVAGGGTSTKIDFRDTQATLLQGAVVTTVDVHPVDRLGLSVAGGATIGGRVDYLGVRHALRPGWIAGVGASYRVIDGRGKLPFLHLSATYSQARAQTRAPDGSDATFKARDWRLGAALGKAVTTTVAPFVVARWFGAGTDWSVGGGKGSDHFRYHVGVGTAVALGTNIDAMVELAFLGERRGTLGVGYTF